MPGPSSTLTMRRKAVKVQQDATFGFNWLVVGLLITSPHNCVAHTQNTHQKDGDFWGLGGFDRFCRTHKRRWTVAGNTSNDFLWPVNGAPV